MKRWFAILLCLALCTSGICAFAGCGGRQDPPPVDDSGGFDVVEGMIELSDWAMHSGVPDNCIKVHSEEEDAVFLCVAEFGNFWDIGMQRYSSQVELSSDEVTYWYGYGSKEIGEPPTDNKTYVEIYVREGEQYIGYGLIGIKPTISSWTDCSAVVICSELFADGDRGKTFEQVQELIAENKLHYETSGGEQA